jgi:ADP-heptose:LPS heptosyltransferase
MNRILFITSNRIGDAVLSSGILAQLIDSYPGAEVTVACGPLPAPLFADTPGLVTLHPIAKQGRRQFRHWWDLWRAMAPKRWSVVADVRSPLFAWTVSAGRRMVCRAEKRHEHRVVELGRLLGLAVAPAPRLSVSPERRARIAASLGDGPPILALGPTANWAAKQWPADRFASLADRLTGPNGPLPGARIAVFGAAHERAAAQPLLDAVDGRRLLDFIGAPDLLDCFAILRQSALFVGNDSGLMHMAAAAGIPTLGLFGPSAEWRYAPWGSHCAVARTPESYAELTGAPGFDFKSRTNLMGGLTVETVVAAAVELWERVKGGADDPTSAA